MGRGGEALREYVADANVALFAREVAQSSLGCLMLDPTFRAGPAHIVQFRSVGAERITDNPPQLPNRSREFTVHDTLPYP